MHQRFRNYHLLRWHLLYLRYHRVPIVRKPLRRMDFNNRSFFFGGNGGQNLLKTFSAIFKNPNDSYVDPSHAREIANTATSGSAADAGSVDIGVAASSAGSAAKAGAELIPGVKQIESIGGAISWIGNNWDRILWVVGGFILLLLGLALLTGRTKVSQMNPATKFPTTAKKG